MECVEPFFFFFNVYDDDECGEGGSFCSLSMTVCSCILGKPHMQPSLGALILPLKKCGANQNSGAVRQHLWCGYTLGYVPSHRLRRVASWLGLGLCCAGVLPRCLNLVGLLYMFCLNMPSWLRILVNFHTCACKTCIYQNSWKMWVVNPNSKFWHSYLFYFVSMLVVEMWVKDLQQHPKLSS